MRMRVVEYCAQTGRPLDAITHCVHVGTRDGREVWAVGYFSDGCYSTAIVEHDGTEFAASNTTYDTHVVPLYEIAAIR